MKTTEAAPYAWHGDILAHEQASALEANERISATADAGRKALILNLTAVLARIEQDQSASPGFPRRAVRA
ncbi:MAG TPA: hypothetical protein VN256_16695 [Pyrinomonadaceae bacterium]|nr:hypothetical protein [Pyrinomonadaceae bacterium]